MSDPRCNCGTGRPGAGRVRAPDLEIRGPYAGEDGRQPEYWAWCRNCCRYRRRVELREIWIRDGCLDLEGEKRCKAESAKFYEYGVR